jgi:hypothetical protein
MNLLNFVKCQQTTVQWSNVNYGLFSVVPQNKSGKKKGGRRGGEKEERRRRDGGRKGKGETFIKVLTIYHT